MAIFTAGKTVGIYTLDSYRPIEGLGHFIGRVRGQLLVALEAELARDPELGAMEITSTQLIVILKLASQDRPASTSELCKGISYDAGAMTRMLDRLEAKGLIKRSRCEEDRRVVLLELTEAGRTAYPRLREISMQVVNRSLSDFTPAEAAQLESLLLRMSRNLTEGQS